jgi:hypothetical protein
MSEEKCVDCTPAILVKELRKKVDKLEERQDKIEDKMEVHTKETSASISSLKESHAETKAYAKATLEQISDLKSLFKNNNESNLNLILKMVETNANALVINNKTNLEANKVTQEITRDIEVNSNTNKVEITKTKMAIFGSIVAAIVTVVSLLIDKFL